MRILYASTCVPTSRAAHAIQIDAMCRAFRAAGHDVTLTAFGPAGRARRPYRQAILPPLPQRLRLRAMQAWTRLWRRVTRADVVFTRSALLALAALGRGGCVVLELHALPEPGSQTDAALRRAMGHPGLRRIVTISRLLGDDLLARYGGPHPGCDLVVAHDGADPGPLGPPPRNARLRVGYFGHLYPGKGMEVIAALAPLLPALRFEVFGGAPADLAQWRGRMQGQGNLCLHGHLPHEQVAARMAACDVLIAPYGDRVSHSGRGEVGRWMSPLKLFEYMAAGRPIVTSDLPVLREVLSHGETALLCPPGDVDAFAQALRQLARDPALCARLADTARARLVAHHTWERRGQSVLAGLERHG